jgi:hypothetical protein
MCGIVLTLGWLPGLGSLCHSIEVGLGPGHRGRGGPGPSAGPLRIAPLILYALVAEASAPPPNLEHRRTASATYNVI